MPIYKRGLSYRVDVYVNGRRVRKTAKTRKEAERLEKELIAQDVNGTFPTESVEDIAFRDFSPRYLAYSKLNKAEKTAQEDARRVNAHFLPFFGDRREDDDSREYAFTYQGQRLRSQVKKTLRTILNRAGIENCTLHTLRHTFASHLAMQGFPLMHIQQLLGHTDYNTTLVYAHLSKESQRGHVHRLPFGSSEKDA